MRTKCEFHWHTSCEESYARIVNVCVDLGNCFVKRRLRFAEFKHLLLVFFVRVDRRIFDPGAEMKGNESIAMDAIESAYITCCECRRSRHTWNFPSSVASSRPRLAPLSGKARL